MITILEEIAPPMDSIQTMQDTKFWRNFFKNSSKQYNENTLNQALSVFL